MSKPVKILALVAVVALLISVVLTMLGKPPNLPLGPLKGALAGEEESTDTSTTPTIPTVSNPCPPGQVLAGSPSTGSGATGTGAGATGTGADATGAGAAGAGATGAGATGTATGATGTGAGATGAGATGAGATDTGTPSTGVPATTGAILSGVSYRGDRPTMLRVADALPAAGTTGATGTPSAADPTGAGAAGAGVATGTPAVGATGAAASAGTADPAATGQASCIPDPALGGAGAGTPGAGTPGAGAGTSGAGTGVPAVPANTRIASDGTNSGNSPEALRIAGEIAGVMKQVNLNVTTTATLFPGAGGAAPLAQRKIYRSRVTTAVVVVKLTDATTVQQWGSAGKPTQITLVKSFMQRLGKNYPKASRSVTVTDSTGNVLAIGDAAPGGGAKAGRVIVY